MNTFKKNSPICPHFTQQVKCERIAKELSNSLPFYSAGTFGALFKSTHQFASILPSRSMANTFKKNSPIPSGHIRQVHWRHFLKEFITSPMRYVLKELAGYFLKELAGYFLKVPSHVITMCPTLYPVGTL